MIKALLAFVICWFCYCDNTALPPEAYAKNYQVKFPKYEVVWLPQKADMTVECTAYWVMDPIDASGTGITATGNRCIAGHTLAVDPKIIPLGSEVYFHSDGTRYIADDTGSAIKGFIVDRAMDSKEEALKYGRRMEHITVTYPTRRARIILTDLGSF